MIVVARLCVESLGGCIRVSATLVVERTHSVSCPDHVGNGPHLQTNCKTPALRSAVTLATQDSSRDGVCGNERSSPGQFPVVSPRSKTARSLTLPIAPPYRRTRNTTCIGGPTYRVCIHTRHELVNTCSSTPAGSSGATIGVSGAEKMNALPASTTPFTAMCS